MRRNPSRLEPSANSSGENDPRSQYRRPSTRRIESTALKACCVVSKLWIHRTRKHLHSHRTLRLEIPHRAAEGNASGSSQLSRSPHAQSFHSWHSARHNHQHSLDSAHTSFVCPKTYKKPPSACLIDRTADFLLLLSLWSICELWKSNINEGSPGTEFGRDSFIVPLFITT